jgi:glycosyltransferase involved in cell wall biosynthesis
LSLIKVAHIITKLELGGAQQNTLYTLVHLNRQQFQPVLITGTEGILIEDANRLQDVTRYYVRSLVREVNPIQDLKAVFKIWRVLLEEKPAIVHTHSSKAGIVGRWAAKLAGVPIIIHSIHGFGFHDVRAKHSPDEIKTSFIKGLVNTLPLLQQKFFIFLEYVTAPITTYFIAVSRANIEKGIALNLFDSSRVSLIRSGIEIASFRDVVVDRTEKLKGFGYDPDTPVVGMIACFKPQKAPLDFIRVARLVHQQVPEARFLMVGDGELRPQIESSIRELGLSGVVRLTGWRRDIPEILHTLNILVLTSLWEGLPRVFPQAMAAGVPIVATGVDGAPEAIKDGINGYLLPPGDIKGLADRVIYLLRHPDLTRKMGQQGLSFVDEFDSDQMVRQQEELYSRAISEFR